MLNPFRIKSKLELKNTNSDTYKSTIENDTLSADSTVKLPNFATNTLASVNNAQTFTADQAFQATADATLGAEVITNAADRDMSGANNWSGTNWTVTGGVYDHTAGANVATLATYAAVIGELYQISLTINTTVNGSIVCGWGGKTNTFSPTIATSGNTFTLYVIASSTAGLTLTPSAAWVGSVDNVSIRVMVKSTSPLNITNASGAAVFENRSVNTTSIANGFEALAYNYDGVQNAAYGVNALRGNMTGSYNNAFGYNALATNQGTHNCAFGTSALAANTYGTGNIAIGFETMLATTTGIGNTGIGYQSLRNQTSALNNVAVGYRSGASITSGGSNTLLGGNAAPSLTTGSNNTIVGYSTASTLTNGASNVFLGYGAGSGATSGLSSCLYLGVFAGRYNTASNKLFIDNQSRTDTAGDLAGAIIHGTFSATPASQTLVFNAACTSTYGHTSPYFNTSNSAMFINSNTSLGAISLSYIVDTTAGAVSLTLPALTAGLVITIKDGKATFGTNKCLIIPATGEKIDGYAANDTLALDVNDGWIELQPNASNERWVITSSTIPNQVATLAASKVLVSDASGFVAASSVASTDLPSKAADNTWAGFQALGTGNAAIKCKVITGTTNGAQGGTVNVSHGLSANTKVIGSSAIVRADANTGITPGYMAAAGYEFYYLIGDSVVVVTNYTGNSSNILSKTVDICIWYIA